MTEINWTELIIFSGLFLIVAVMGFVAARWRRPASMHHLDEWGLGGRSFGGWVTWFLVGGDLYTAYTFVAVPALLYAAGAMASSRCLTRWSRIRSCSSR
jgi:SSS family solute:Na+ symporter